MAQIPVPNFGQAVAQPGGGVTVPTPNIGGGIESVGQDLMNYGIQRDQQQQQAKAALALATSINQAHAAHDEIVRGVISGQITPTDAPEQLRQRMSDIATTNGANLTRQQQGMYTAHMAGLGGQLGNSLNGAIVKYNQSETAATIDATGAQLQQDAQRRGPAAAADTYDGILDVTGASAGFTPAQIEQKKIAFRQSTTHGYYDDASTAMYAAGDQRGIANMLTTVASGQLPAGQQLSQEQRAHLTTKLIGFNSKLLADQARAENDAERERVARENAAADWFNGAQKIILNGQYLDQQTMDAGAALTVGTTLEQRTRELLAAQPHIVAFASESAPRRAALLEHYRSEASNPNIGTSPDAQKQLAGLQAIDAKANEMAKDNPWQAAQTYGVITNAPALPMSPDGLAQTLDLRMQQINKVETWVGHKVSPLQPAEAQQLVEAMKGMSAPQAASLLGQIGQSVGDPERIAAIAKQFQDKDGNYGVAMAYGGDRTETGKLTSEYILRGAQALRDKTSQVDNAVQSGWRATIAKEIRGAFSSQEAEDNAIDAAFKITAARDASGEASGDTSTAIRMATGGIIKHGAADAKIPLPVGVDEKGFNQRLASITPALLQAQAPDGNAYVGGVPMPLQQFVASLPSATLVHAGQGQYVVRGGNTFVTNQAGQRIVLRISQ